MNLKPQLSCRLRELRQRCGLTQGQVAEKLSLSVQAVSKWETGKNLPDITLLPEIADLYGVTIDELFRESQESPFCNHTDTEKGTII